MSTEPNLAGYFLTIALTGVLFSIFLFFHANRRRQAEEGVIEYEKIVKEKEKALQQAKEQYKEVKAKYETLNKNYKELNLQKKQTEAVIHSVTEGLVVVNQKGEVLLMNPAAQRLLNVKKEEKIGQSILKDLKEEHFVSLVQGISGSEEKEIILNSQSDETRKILRASNAIIEDESGQTVGMVSILSDVTKQKELDELKSKFVANVSHDFKNPLNTIQETFAMLREKTMGDVNPQQEKMLGLAQGEVERLSRMINDLLDFSKIEARELRLKPANFLLGDWLTQVVANFELWAKNKKIALALEAPSESIELKADRDRLTQVLTNLLGNAFKFTPSGGKIIVKTEKIEGQKPGAFHVRVSVHDTGSGIPKRYQARIFEKFFQIDAASSPQTGLLSGTGLGLAISKEMVELHRGRIWVESEEGRGSCFTFEIPQNLQE